MIRRSFRMTLKEGKLQEYKKKHDEVWTEVSEILTSSGVTNYSIYYDKKDNTLIEYMELTDNNTFDQMEFRIRDLIEDSVQLELNSPKPDNLITTLSNEDNKVILSNQSLILLESISIGDKLWLIIKSVF